MSRTPSQPDDFEGYAPDAYEMMMGEGQSEQDLRDQAAEEAELEWEEEQKFYGGAYPDDYMEGDE